jgi:Protein-arginine deiminase (PAD)/PKD domain
MSRARPGAALIVGASLLVTPIHSQAQVCADRSNIIVYYAVDRSGSMAGTRQVAASNFSVALLDQLNATGFLEAAGGFSFSDCVVGENLITTNISSIRAELAAVATASTSLHCWGGTHTVVYDAIIAGAGVIYAQPASKTRLYVVLTDGEHSGTTTTPAMAAAALPAGVASELILIANPGDPGHAGLQAIAAAAGAHVQVRATTSLNALVSGIVNRTCRNFRPTASFSMSDSDLRLGHEGFTITFNGSGSSDIDGSISSFQWRLTRPDGSTVDLTGPTHTVTFNDSQLPGENWSARLTVRDNDGATHDLTQTFQVRGSPPDVVIAGATAIDVLQPLNVSVAPTTDVDGGNLTFSWDIVSSPAGSTHAPQSNFSTAASIPPIATVESDIGTFVFRVTATDNEGNTDTDEHTVEVRNLPPEIDLVGDADIDVGDTITAETSIVDDDDGGQLSFSWDILQSPDPAGIPPQTGYFGGTGTAGSRLTIPTTGLHAGTWIFRLTVTDNDGAPNSSVSDELTVLVDAPPESNVAGPATIGSLSFPLRLRGGGSIDPDTDAPHTRLDSGTPTVSPGISHYTWLLVDVPFEHWSDYALGPIDEALGVEAHSADATIDFLSLEVGDWRFELQVNDAEGNNAASAHAVAVIEEGGLPFALVSGPARYEANAMNVVQRAVVVDGGASFDLDNVLGGATLGPGIGIANYAWSVASAPPGCTPPALPSGAAATSVILFAAGVVVDPACLGFWQVNLTVTDDDPTPRTASNTATLMIGNCPQLICIDYPTTAIPELVEFTNDTDVLIHYHLDAGVYSLAPFVSGGLLAELAIFHESDLTTPFYSDSDPNPLATGLGGLPVFQWDGYGNLRQRPQPGKYTVRITLLDSLLTLSTTTTQQVDAIQIATAEPSILPTSDALESVDAFADGTGSFTMNYTVAGAAAADQIRLRVFDSGNVQVFTMTEPATLPAGTITWDGMVMPATPLGVGAYEAEIDALRSGSILGTSGRHAFKGIRTDLDVDADRNTTLDDTADDIGEDAWTNTRGAIFGVNLDRDGSRTAGAVPIPDAVDFDDAGRPTNEDFLIDNAADALDVTPVMLRGLGTPLPAGIRAFLKVAEREDIESIHVFKAIAAGETSFWGALGSRTGGAPQPLEFDVTDLVNPGSVTFVGAGPAGDVTFGIEGMFFRNTGPVNAFDGEIDLTLEFRNGAMVVFSDAVRLKVAPWIMVPHTQPSTQIWALDAGADNASFRQNAAAAAGYRGLDHSAQLNTATPATGQTQWFQDHVETGYYERPGGPKTIATFRLPYNRGGNPQPEWVPFNLLRPNFATFQHGVNMGPDTGAPTSGSGGYGGNVEVLPPTATHRLGRIVVGDTRSDPLRTFFDSQEVQAPVQIPTRWLGVGHVDEVMAFTASGTGVVIADPRDAYATLDAIPVADRGKSVFFATGALPVDGTVTAGPAAPNRLNVGIDLTGTTWGFVRIYRGTGIGQVGRISARGVGFLEVDRVWNTGTKVIAGGGVVNTIFSNMFVVAPNAPGWIVTPAAGDQFVLVEGTRFWAGPLGDGTPAILTVEELLADADLRALNETDAHNEIATARTTVQTAAGGGLTFINVPVLYVGDRAGFATGRSGVAFNPGLSNVQLAGGLSFFPRQFGPRNAAGDDLFERSTRLRVPTAEFVDDWDLYHRLEGEVHCGSTVLRVPPPLSWWTIVP